jgi:hypothetical protein
LLQPFNPLFPIHTAFLEKYGGISYSRARSIQTRFKHIKRLAQHLYAACEMFQSGNEISNRYHSNSSASQQVPLAEQKRCKPWDFQEDVLNNRFWDDVMYLQTPEVGRTREEGIKINFPRGWANIEGQGVFVQVFQLQRDKPRKDEALQERAVCSTSQELQLLESR